MNFKVIFIVKKKKTIKRVMKKDSGVFIKQLLHKNLIYKPPFLIKNYKKRKKVAELMK